MAFPASEPIRQAGVILNDVDGVRWPFQERLDWINGALAEILSLKPSALGQSRQVSLGQGTRQAIPADASALLRVVRNITAGFGGVRVGGRVVEAVSRPDMDAAMPDWHDVSIHPSAAIVQHVIADPEEPKAFYVYPPNNGAGMVEALVAIPHPPLATPTSPNALASYEGVVVGLAVEYKPAVLDYLLSRCFQKEAELAGSAARAQAHYLAFANSLGVKLANEKAYHVTRTYAERAP